MKKFLRFLLLAALLVPLGARAQLSLPINEGFENSATLTAWTATNCHPSTGVSTSDSYEGSSCFMFYYTTSPNQFIITPEFEPASGTEMVSFWYKNNSTYYTETFEVGFSSTTNDTTAFTWGQTVTVTNSTEWLEYTAAVPAGTKYVSIKCTSNDQLYLYIDNVYIGEAPTCFRVQSIAASGITSDEMTVSWVDTVNDNTTYTLYFWADGATDTIEESGLSTTSYTFTDLDAGTIYWFSVVPECDEGVNPRIGSAATEISCEDGACNITFNMTDSYGDGWNGNEISVYQDSVLMGSATISDGASATAQIMVCSGTAIRLVYTSGMYAGEMGGTVIDGGGGVIFNIESMGGYADNATLANVANPCPACLAPVALDTVMNEDGDITLTWSSSSTVFSVYDNGVLVADDVTDTFYTFVGLSASSVHVLGVAAGCDDGGFSGTSTLTVATPCGAISSMPWSTGFEFDEAYTAPMCWTIVNYTDGDSANYPYVYNYTTHSGGRSVSFDISYEGDTNLMVSSPITYNPANLQVKYWLYSYLSDATFEVGLMTDPYDASTFIVMKSLTSDSPDYYTYNYTQYEFYTDSLDFEEGDTAYLAFRLRDGYGYCYIDDIEMNAIPNCRMPFAGSGMISNIQHESAYFEWDGTSENGYDLMLVGYTVDQSGYPIDTNIVHVFSDTTSIQVDTLVANTFYYAYVASLCDNDGEADTTEYLLIGSFQTNMRCYPVASVHLASVTQNAAAITWNYVEQGIAGSATILTLTDLSTPNAEPSVITVEDATSHVYTGLVPGHTYTVQLNGICGDEGDTAFGKTVYFTTHAPACAQAFPESQATAYTQSTPVYSSDYYSSSYSQTLYNASIVDGLDTLTGVSYHAYFYDESYADINNFTVNMYIGVVDTSALTYYGGQYFLNNAIPVNNTMVQVASNRTFSVTHNGWFYIPFDTPYALPALDEGKRLVVTVTGSCVVGGTSNYWWCKSDYVYDANYNYYYKGRYYYEYDGTIDPTNPSLSTYGSSYIPNIQFHGNCSNGCLAPSASVSATDANSITLQIFANGTENSWQVEYMPLGDTAWTLAGTATASPYTINGLSGGMGYQIRIGANCTDTMVYCTPMTVYTACAGIMPPYSVTFTSANPCWSTNYGSPSTDNGYNLYSDYYLISPEIAVPLDTLAITINGRTYSTGSSNSGVQIMACDADGSNAVTIATLNLPNTVFSDVTVYLMNYTGTQNHFKIRNYDNGDVYVKSVSIDYLPACMPVSNVTMDTNSANSITLSWNVNSPNVGFTVAYRAEGSNAWSNMNVSTNSATITGLTASTNYEVQVFTNCSDGTTMTTPTMMFSTECLPMTVPYTQSLFYNLPACWSANTIGHPSVSWEQSISNGYGYIVSAATGGTTIANDWLMTPAVVIPTTAANDSVMIIYQIAGMGDSYYTGSIARYELLVAPNGDFNFTDTLIIDTLNSNYFSYRRFPTAQYAGDTIRIAFRNTSAYYGQVAMYDFGVRSILNPFYYIEGEATTFVGDVNGYKAIRVEGETTGINYAWTSTMAAAGQATVTGANTDSLTITYTAAGYDTIMLVVSNAYGSDTSRGVVHVFDLAPVTMFPYTTGFEADDSDNNSWITLNGDNAWVLGTADGDNGNQSMIVSNDGVSNVYNATPSVISYVYRALQISDTGDYTFSFDWKCLAESNYDYLRVWLIPDAHFNIEANVMPGEYTYMPDLATADIPNWIALGGKLNQNTVWTNQTDTVNIATPGRYFLTFMWGNDGSVANQPPAAFDNVTISNGGVSCPMPEVSSVVSGEDYLTINFTSPVDSVEIVVVEGQFNPDVTGVIVGGNNYTATDLTYSTVYTVALRSICGDGVTSAWVIRTDSTLMVNCEAPTALAVTGTSYSSISLGWTPAGNEQAWQVNLYNTTLDTTVTVTTTSVTIDNLPAGTQFGASVRALCGQNSNIEGPYCDVVVVSTDACQATTGVSVAEGSTTATVTWDDMGSTSYRIVWGERPFNPLDAEGEATVSTNSYQITGLQPETEYSVVVYNNCAEGLSVPSSTVNFSTTEASGTMYTITVVASPADGGTVTGSGTYEEGANVTITATANEGYTFIQWQDGNTESTRTIVVTGNATYTATFTADVQGIGDVMAGTMSLYPNPASTSVTLGLEGFEGEVSIDVVDMNGRVVYQTNTTSTTVTVDVTELSQGAYFVRVVSGTQTAVRKLVVK